MFTTQYQTDLPDFDSYQYSKTQLLFFDIETTGFLGRGSFVYLIGACYYRAGKWNTIQWFASNTQEEPMILSAFFEFCQSYSYLISYNGDGFDMVFLKERANALKMEHPFCDCESLDLYRMIQPLKHILKVENLKQKTIENFLGLQREDRFSGKELISIYENYQKTHSDKDKCYLLLHNKEDVEGLIHLFPMLSYVYLFQGNFQLTDVQIKDYENINKKVHKECMFWLNLPFRLPVRISYGKNDIYMTGYDNHMKVRIKVYLGELKYFYSNYKDYYYLPAEDTSLHKSVAYYVDKDFRVQAKASTCYSRKDGFFLPQYKQTISPYFKKEYKDTLTYFECTTEILNNSMIMGIYLKEIFEYMLQNKK